MDDNYKFYAKPLDKNNIYELKYNLNHLMDTLNEQNDCVKYVKNSLKNERLNQELVYNKVLDLLNKFEELINNEIKSINSFIIDISSKKLIEISEALKNRYEEIRNNFNKIMSNLNKMLDSNPEVREIKENYYSNKTPNLNGSKSHRPTKSKRETNDERRNKINDYNESVDENSYDQSKTSCDAIKVGDNMDNLENQISSLYKNINSTNYKAKNASIPRRPLSKTSSNSNLAVQKEDKIKNIKTYHNEKVYFQNLQNFVEELEHVKDFCRNLQKTQQENCLIANERKNFDKMKSDVIKISSDVNVLKDEFQEIHTIFKQITSRINNLEEENNSLKNQNKSLIKNIKQASSVYQPKNEYISIEDDYASEEKPIKGTMYNDKPTNQNNSKFNSQNNFVANNIENTNNIISNNNRSKTGVINNYEEANMSGFSDLQSMQNNSSIEMNLNLKNNTQSINQNNNSKRRFLIPK